MLSKRLQRASVLELEGFLNRKREYLLTSKQITEIQNLVKKRKETNGEFADKLIESKLWKLACAQLKIEGKGIRYIFREQGCYEYEPMNVIDTMVKIIHTAEKKGIKL